MDKICKLFERQIENQVDLIKSGKYDRFANVISDELPRDDVGLFSYHIQQLLSELGEVLEADKRWKNFRNAKYDKDAKLDELSDCLIVLMNIVMFSGFDIEELMQHTEKKIDVIARRIKDER